jgi:hypothetical protein
VRRRAPYGCRSTTSPQHVRDPLARPIAIRRKHFAVKTIAHGIHHLRVWGHEARLRPTHITADEDAKTTAIGLCKGIPVAAEVGVLLPTGSIDQGLRLALLLAMARGAQERTPKGMGRHAHLSLSVWRITGRSRRPSCRDASHKYMDRCRVA